MSTTGQIRIAVGCNWTIRQFGNCWLLSFLSPLVQFPLWSFTTCALSCWDNPGLIFLLFLPISAINSSIPDFQQGQFYTFWFPDNWSIDSRLKLVFSNRPCLSLPNSCENTLFGILNYLYCPQQNLRFYNPAFWCLCDAASEAEKLVVITSSCDQNVHHLQGFNRIPRHVRKRLLFRQCILKNCTFLSELVVGTVCIQVSQHLRFHS